VAQVATEYVTVVVNRRAPYQDLPSFIAAARPAISRPRADRRDQPFPLFDAGQATGLRFRFVTPAAAGRHAPRSPGHVDCAFLTVTKQLWSIRATSPSRHCSRPRPAQLAQLKTAREQGTDLLLNLNYWCGCAHNRRATASTASPKRCARRCRTRSVQKMRDFDMTPASQGRRARGEVARQYAAMQELARANDSSALTSVLIKS